MAGDNLKVLSALDSAKTQWYHFTAIIIAGMGFFTDAYDLFCISLVTKMLGRIYYHQEGAAKPGSLPPNYHCRKMIITNGELRAGARRAVTNSSQARTTVVTFITPDFNSIVERAGALVSNNPPLYRAFQYREFLTSYTEKIGDTETVLMEPFK